VIFNPFFFKSAAFASVSMLTTFCYLIHRKLCFFAYGWIMPDRVKF